MLRKNMFSINLDRDDLVTDHEELIIRRESAELSAKRNELNNGLHKAIMKSIGIKDPLRICALIAVAIGLAFWSAVFEEYTDSQVFLTLPACIGVLFFAVAILLFVIGKIRKKDSKTDTALDAIDNEFEKLNEQSCLDMNVPKDAQEAEVFIYMYDEEHMKNADEEERVYENDTVSVFEEDGKLCLYYFDCVMAIEKNSIEDVVKVEKEIAFGEWLKDISHDQGEYLQYNIVKEEGPPHAKAISQKAGG